MLFSACSHSEMRINYLLYLVLLSSLCSVLSFFPLPGLTYWKSKLCYVPGPSLSAILLLQDLGVLVADIILTILLQYLQFLYWFGQFYCCNSLKQNLCSFHFICAGTLLPSNLFGLCKGKRRDESNVWLGFVKGREEGHIMEQLQWHAGEEGRPLRHWRSFSVPLMS